MTGTIEIASQIDALKATKLDDYSAGVLNQTFAMLSRVSQRRRFMNGNLRWLAAVTLACAVMAPAERWADAQSWYAFGGTVAPQSYYTYYAAPPAPFVAYYYPSAVVSQPVVTYSASRVIIPTSAYAPLTTAYAPASYYRPVVTYRAACGQYCGTSVCTPAMLAPSVAAPITFAPAPAPTIVTPTVPRFGTPIYPPPGVYPPAPAATPVYPYQPPAASGSPTSSVSPADQPPTLSGYPPFDSALSTPLGTGSRVPPNLPDAGGASPSSMDDATTAPTTHRLRPDLDISIPAEEDEALSPVKPSETSNQAEDAAAGPRVEGDEGHTASMRAPRTGLLSPATWRAVRPSLRRGSGDRKSPIPPSASP